MNKKILLSAGAIIVLGVGYWLVSPIWRTVELDEQLPVAQEMAPVIQDDLEEMDAETKADMDAQTEEMPGGAGSGSAGKDEDIEKKEPMPANGPIILATNNLVARAHEVEGSASFVKSGNETFLRFENLKTINGPDLRIYLSSGLNADDIVDLGPIRATEGNVNYAVPAGTDLSKYKYAMIWCRAFSVLFSYAELGT